MKGFGLVSLVASALLVASPAHTEARPYPADEHLLKRCLPAKAPGEVIGYTFLAHGGSVLWLANVETPAGIVSIAVDDLDPFPPTIGQLAIVPYEKCMPADRAQICFQ